MRAVICPGVLLGRLFVMIAPVQAVRLEVDAAQEGQRQQTGNEGTKRAQHEIMIPGDPSRNQQPDPAGLPHLSVHQLHQLVHDLLRDLAALRDRGRRAVLQVIPGQLACDAPQRRLHRSHLGEDVRTVAIVLDHAVKPPHLPLDAAETLEIPFSRTEVDADGLSVTRVLLVVWMDSFTVGAHARLVDEFTDVCPVEGGGAGASS